MPESLRTASGWALAAVCVALTAVDAAAAQPPRAVRRFLKEVREDPGLAEMVAPTAARRTPFSLHTVDGESRLVRVRAAPPSAPAEPRFGKPGPWLLVYNPRTESVIQAIRLPLEAAAHVESLRPGTRRMTASRLDPRRLRKRLTLSTVDDAWIFLVDEADRARRLDSPPLELPVDEPPPCSAVYRILGSADPVWAINLLVLPAGFAEAELDVFRCAAQRMFSQLLASATPIGDRAASVNVFRMDLPDADARPLRERLGCEASPVQWASRTAECAEASAFAGTEWAPASSTDVSPISIELYRKGDETGVCGTVFPTPDDGFDTVGDAVACVPQVRIDAVVVLVNSGAWFGGGDFQTTPPTAVVSLNEVGSDDGAWYLLAHELGHTLGLLDEYDEGAGLPDTEGRNVAFTVAEPPVWHAHCPSHPPNVSTCDGAAPDDACEVFCQTSPGNGCCTSCPSDRAGQADTGLWEGAQYLPCGRFRSRETCLMREDLSVAPPPRVFCEACEDWMAGELDRWRSPLGDLSSYLGGEAVDSGFSGGPGMFNVPGSGRDLPEAWDAVRALVRTRAGIAEIAPDRIEASVKTVRRDGRRARCEVEISGPGLSRCTTECGDALPTSDCSAAMEALVTDGDRLKHAKAYRGRRDFRLEGMRLRRTQPSRP